MEQRALADLGVDPIVAQTLERARERFEATMPDITHIRNALLHFEKWSRGEGFGLPTQLVRAGSEASTPPSCVTPWSKPSPTPKCQSDDPGVHLATGQALRIEARPARTTAAVRQN